jgi:hypothetical protein
MIAVERPGAHSVGWCSTVVIFAKNAIPVGEAARIQQGSALLRRT